MKKNGTAQPIEMTSYGTFYANKASKDNKELQGLSALEILKKKMDLPPQQVCLASYENKRLNSEDPQRIIHLIYLNREAAHTAAIELAKRYTIYPLGSASDKPAIIADSMIRMIAPKYLEKYGEDVCVLRFRVHEMVKIFS